MWLDLHESPHGNSETMLHMVVAVVGRSSLWWGAMVVGGDAAAGGGGAMVGSLREEAVLFRASAFFSLLAIGAQRSAAQDCQGEEARLERNSVYGHWKNWG